MGTNMTTLLIGEYRPEPASGPQIVVQCLAYVLAAALLLPWVLMGVGLIMVGSLAISRGQQELIICLPAGVALLAGVPLITYLKYRWHPTVQRFQYDGTTLQFLINRQTEYQSQLATEVSAIYRRKRPKGRRVTGHEIYFRDGTKIYLPCWLSNADLLVSHLTDVMESSIPNR